ncbi:hypothetical protein ANANG_G00218590 [Anguilla anguilla]|uniref:Uncharacterized protein n=1 Tax=Anguilla anguilla TaxID=7936 RepID=A0A9D3LZE8_ANGAN|nr:hypothetical protein ANANG_G00218590 [Anguilla anguilla]
MMLDANKGPARYGEHCAQRCELLAQNYTLLLRSVTLEDAGVYKVTDPETKKTISSVSLHVSAPSLTCRPELLTCLPNGGKPRGAFRKMLSHRSFIYIALSATRLAVERCRLYLA